MHACVFSVTQAQGTEVPAVRPQVMYVYENLKYGHASLDDAATITCASAVSREEVVDQNGTPQVHLVSATQLTVRGVVDC